MLRFIYVIPFLTVLLTANSIWGQSGLPLLEEYSFQIGDSSGVELNFLDPSLGKGNAEVRFQLQPVGKGGYQIKLEVFRHVSQNVITFALLLERVEIGFVSASGEPIRTIVLDQILGESGLFIIGDSSDGYFQRKFTAESLGGARGVTLKLFGNYE